MATCPACAHAMTPPQPAPAPFVRCSRCDVDFAHPMPAVDGEWYHRQEMYQVRDGVAALRLQWNHREFFKDRVAPGGRLLDVGCGTGEFVAAARQAGYEAAGFDFDAGAVQAAQARFGLTTVFAGDLQALAQAPAAYDVITAFEVLEHHPQPQAFVAAIAAALRPGGHLAVSVPNRERRPRLQYDWDAPPNHVTRWSPAALRQLLERQGFLVQRAAYGWAQGESFLHQHLQFGVVTRLLRRGRGAEGAAAPSSVALASRAYRLKEAAVRCLAVPVNAALQLMGDTGMTQYLLTQKVDGS